jgi:hypothetical protein
MSLQRAFANPSDVRNTAQLKVLLRQSRQQSNHIQEAICVLCGFVAGAFQGFFVSLLVGAVALLFIYLKNHNTRLVEDDYCGNYILGVLIGSICYYFGWLVAIGSIALVLLLSTRQGNIFNKAKILFHELKHYY